MGLTFYKHTLINLPIVSSTDFVEVVAFLQLRELDVLCHLDAFAFQPIESIVLDDE